MLRNLPNTMLQHIFSFLIDGKGDVMPTNSEKKHTNISTLNMLRQVSTQWKQSGEYYKTAADNLRNGFLINYLKENPGVNPFNSNWVSQFQFSPRSDIVAKDLGAIREILEKILIGNFKNQPVRIQINFFKDTLNAIKDWKPTAAKDEKKPSVLIANQANYSAYPALMRGLSLLHELYLQLNYLISITDTNNPIDPATSLDRCQRLFKERLLSELIALSFSTPYEKTITLAKDPIVVIQPQDAKEESYSQKQSVGQRELSALSMLPMVLSLTMFLMIYYLLDDSTGKKAGLGVTGSLSGISFCFCCCARSFANRLENEAKAINTFQGTLFKQAESADQDIDLESGVVNDQEVKLLELRDGEKDMKHKCG